MIMNRILSSPFSRATCRGFTLIEVIVSLFVFLIIMLALSSTFAQSFTGYRNTRAVQRDVESAQFALNLMAKELRTSTVVSSTANSVTFYDYSQAGKCFKYEIANDQLTVASKDVTVPPPPAVFDPIAGCAGGFPSSTPLVKTETTAGTVRGTFRVIPSEKSPSKKVGKVTTSLQISEGPKHTANVQTTSSLRDYGYIGLIGN
jgi:prepilin-type N-terminal cleavage/methylation domain-containing protein